MLMGITFQFWKFENEIKLNGIASCDIRRWQYKIIKDNKDWQIKTDMVWWNGETKLFCVLWVSQ